LGALLLSIAIGAILLLITSWATFAQDRQILVLIGLAGAVAFIVWVPIQLRKPHPLVDLRLAATPRVAMTNVYAIITGFGMIANLLLITQRLQIPMSGGGFGLTPFQAGLCMLPSGLVIAALSPAVGRVVQRTPARVALSIGSGAMAVGYLLLAVVHSSIASLIIGSLVVAIGTSFALSAQPLLIMQAARPDETAAANGLNALLRSIGTAVASATIAGVLAAHILRTESEFPPIAAFVTLDVIAACACLLGTLMAALIPSRGA
jgi:predicted MFS family arabinose efflux permease